MTTTTYLPRIIFMKDANANTIVRVVNNKITKVTFIKSNQHGKSLATIDNNIISEEDLTKIKAIYPCAASAEEFSLQLKKILNHFRKNLLVIKAA